MKHKILRSFALSIAALGFALLMGCALNRSEVDVVAPSMEQGQQPAPANGKKVFISAIDERTFQIKPSSADIPSLKNDEINDVAIKERAIARKRNSYGKALGDVVLPSGRTVSQLVGQAVALAYRQAGYEVVNSRTDEAIPVEVHIIEFWSWLAPSYFSVAVNQKSHLRLESPEAAPIEVITSVQDNMKLVSEDDWREINESGLREITRKTKKHLKF